MRITVQTSLCEIMTLHENTRVIPAWYGEFRGRRRRQRQRRRAGLGLALLSTVLKCWEGQARGLRGEAGFLVVKPYGGWWDPEGNVGYCGAGIF